MTSFDRFSGNYADRASLEQVTSVTAETVPPGGDWLKVLYRDKAVRLTKGYYPIYANVTLESDYQIIGAGDGTVVEIPDGLTLAADGSNIRLIDTQILDSSTAAAFPIPSKVTVSSDSDSVSFQNVTFTGPNCGLRDAGSRTKMIGCRWYAPELTSSDSGPLVDITGNGTLVTGCHAFAGGASSSFIFMRLDGASNCRVIANIWDNESGALIDPVQDSGTDNFIDYSWVSSVEATNLLEDPWDDLVVSPTLVNLAGLSRPATYNENYACLQFDAVVDNAIQVVYQMPHGWDNGQVKFHIHWGGTLDGVGTPNVRWGIRTSWVSAVGGAIDQITAATETPVDMAAPVGAGSSYKLDYTTLATINPSVTGLSSLLTIQLERKASTAEDNYSGDILIKSLDIHYRKDAIGSKTEGSKT